MRFKLKLTNWDVKSGQSPANEFFKPSCASRFSAATDRPRHGNFRFEPKIGLKSKSDELIFGPIGSKRCQNQVVCEESHTPIELSKTRIVFNEIENT